MLKEFKPQIEVFDPLKNRSLRVRRWSLTRRTWMRAAPAQRARLAVHVSKKTGELFRKYDF